MHFRAIQLEHLEHEELDDVPAFIYVWKGDEVCFALILMVVQAIDI